MQHVQYKVMYAHACKIMIVLVPELIKVFITAGWSFLAAVSNAWSPVFLYIHVAHTMYYYCIYVQSTHY